MSTFRARADRDGATARSAPSAGPAGGGSNHCVFEVTPSNRSRQRWARGVCSGPTSSSTYRDNRGDSAAWRSQFPTDPGARETFDAQRREASFTDGEARQHEGSSRAPAASEWKDGRRRLSNAPSSWSRRIRVLAATGDWPVRATPRIARSCACIRPTSAAEPARIWRRSLSTASRASASGPSRRRLRLGRPVIDAFATSVQLRCDARRARHS
jgi:hypothetical protein